MKKLNYPIFFYSGFVFQMIRVVVLIYMPIYFFNVLDVNRAELAIVQVFCFSILLITPFVGYILDRYIGKAKIPLVLSGIGSLISFFLFTFNASRLWVFGIFIGINFGCSAIFITGVNKVIIQMSIDDKQRDRWNVFFIIGSSAGTVTASLLFVILLDDIYSIAFWELYFLICGFLIVPLIFFLFMMSIEIPECEGSNEAELDVNASNNAYFSGFVIFMGFLILFLLFSPKIIDYPFEPWVLEKFGQKGVVLMGYTSIIFIIIYISSSILAGNISERLNRRRLLIFCFLINGVLFIFLSLTNIVGLILIYCVFQVSGAFTNINIKAVHANISKKKAWVYQLMQCSYYLSWITFLPLGTFLSGVIATETLFILVAVLTFAGLIPLLLLDKQYFLSINQD